MTLQKIVEQLLDETQASRTTLRLDSPALNFPAVAEARVTGVRSIKTDNSLDQRGAATGSYILKTGEMLVQPDCSRANPPPPAQLLDAYGVKAQMLAPVRRDGAVGGWLSVHYTEGVREWNQRDIDALKRAVKAVDTELASLPSPGLCELGNADRLYAFENGVGRPIVFLHGWGSNSGVWKYQLGDLAGKHHVIAIDCRSFGQSPPIDRPTTAALAADVKRFLEARNLSDVFLVGWSMGGLVVMSYCQQFGADRLRAVGIVDVSPRLRPDRDWQMGVGVGRELGSGLERWRSMWPSNRRGVFEELNIAAFAHPENHADEIEWLVDESMKSASNSFEVFEDLFACDFRTSVCKIGVPALLAYGANSTSTTDYVARYMAEALPNAVAITFSESGHSIMLEETDKFNRTLDEFATAH